jgi:hypothetical protein
MFASSIAVASVALGSDLDLGYERVLRYGTRGLNDHARKLGRKEGRPPSDILGAYQIVGLWRKCSAHHYRSRPAKHRQMYSAVRDSSGSSHRHWAGAETRESALQRDCSLLSSGARTSQPQICHLFSSAKWQIWGRERTVGFRSGSRLGRHWRAQRTTTPPTH